MKTLKSYICGRWHEASSGFATLVNPSTEEEIARASSQGIDFGEVLAYAREKGGPALRAMTFAQRSGLLKEMSRVQRDHRDELLDLSRQNNGSTAPDGSFERKAARQAGGNGGGISASRPVCGYPARKRLRQFDGLPRQKKKINRLRAGEVTAFQ